MLALCLVNYFLFFRGEGTPPLDLEAQLRSANPAHVAAPPAEALDEHGNVVGELDDFGEPVGRTLTGVLKRGQTVLKALREQGIDSQTAAPIVRAMGEVFDFRKAQVGDTFTAKVNDEGLVTAFTYQQSPIDIYEVATTADGQYDARKKKVPTRVDVAHIGCAIKSSLYESLQRCGEGSQLAAQVIDIFAWDVDFYQDAREGDNLKIIVEKISVDGRFLQYGKVLAAEYSGKFGRSRIFQYADPNGRSGYYSADGQSAEKEFLKSPLKYTRVSAAASGEVAVRRGIKKAAPVIYTAASKTPVWAVAAGTVISVAETPTLGKTVTIRHENGFTSTYAHLGAIAKGVQQGAFVSQKMVIGQVGQSGAADSPQLLYSLRKGGQLVDPLTARFTEGEPVAPEHQGQFEREVEQTIQDLDATPVIGVTERRS